MAKGDWSNTCLIRPSTFSILCDSNEPPNILSINVAYIVLQPSGLQPNFLYTWKSDNPMPIDKGLTAISDAITSLLSYEGLTLG